MTKDKEIRVIQLYEHKCIPDGSLEYIAQGHRDMNK